MPELTPSTREAARRLGVSDTAMLPTSRAPVAKLGKLTGDSEGDLLAVMAFSPQHRTKWQATTRRSGLSRVQGAALHKRRAGVIGNFPAEATIIRLIGAALLEADAEWKMPRRDMGEMPNRRPR